MSSLRDKTISSVFWSFLQKVGSRGIEVVVTIILARLLSPEDFGLIAMLAVFIAISQSISQAGFSQALIQKKKVDEEDYSSVFYLNLFISIGLYVILYFGAPLIAKFYDKPNIESILISLTRVLSLVFVINAFSYVQETRLIRALKFKKLMYIHLPSTIISGIIAIIMANKGFGVWSIVAQRLIMRFLFAIQIWFYARWKPLLCYNRKKIKKLFSFGGNLMVAGLINTIYDNIYLFVIGKIFSVSTLGYYQNAKKLVDTPTNTLASALKSVTFPVFSKIQDDNERLKEGCRQSVQQILYWLCPLLIIAAVLATPLFRFVLTEKWLPAVPFFQILCIVGIIYPINSYSMNIVNVKGRSDLVLKLDILKKTIITIGIIFAIPFGIWAIVIFQPIYAILAYCINSIVLGRFIDYSFKAQIKDIAPTILLALFTGAIVYVSDYLLQNFSDLSRLLIGGLVGIVIYGSISYKTKFNALNESLSILKNLIHKNQ